jgi:hypothetical protein
MMLSIIRDKPRQGLGVEPRLGRERLGNEARQVQRAQQAGAIGRQWLFAAVVCPQAIGVERIEAGDCGIEYFRLAGLHDRLDRCSERLSIEAPAVPGKSIPQSG